MADRQETEWNDGADPSESATLGNRPATGARLVDHAAGLPSGFGGGQEATDFLGLSHELGGMDVVTTPAPGAAPAPSGWAPAEAAPAPNWLLSDKDPSEAIGPADAETAPAEEHVEVDAGRSRRFVSVAAAALIIGAAVTIAMKLSSGSKSSPTTQLAGPPPTKTSPAPQPFQLSQPEDPADTGRETILDGGETVAVTPVPADVDTTSTTEPSPPVVPTTAATEPNPDPEPVFADPEPVARPAAGRLAEWMSANGWAESPSGEDTDVAAGFPASPSGWPVAAALAFATRSPLSLPGAESLVPADGEAFVEGGDTAAEVVFRPAEGPRPDQPPTAEGTAGTVQASALRLATAEDLAGIWNGMVVPPDALESPTRMLTPAVGNVRVVLKVGEIFDGRLYAVGQGQVWLETTIGRLALNAQQVLRIDPLTTDKDAKVVDGLPRMRVRTPGGLFFGKVLSRDERHVTLLLEGGGRITLESTDVEPAPLGDTRVIGPAQP